MVNHTADTSTDALAADVRRKARGRYVGKTPDAAAKSTQTLRCRRCAGRTKVIDAQLLAHPLAYRRRRVCLDAACGGRDSTYELAVERYRELASAEKKLVKVEAENAALKARRRRAC
jgi:hypothetical protein